MIKYSYNEQTQETTATLTGTKMDAINRIKKVCGIQVVGRQFEIADVYEVTVKPYYKDIPSREMGMLYAREKLLAKYYKDIDKVVSMYEKWFRKCFVNTINKMPWVFANYDYGKIAINNAMFLVKTYGYKMRRKTWEEDTFIYQDTASGNEKILIHNELGNDEEWNPTQEDIMAKDWKLYNKF